MKRSRTPRPLHFIDAAARLAVLERVIGSDAAVAKLLDVDRSEPRSWREGHVPDPETASRLTVLATVVEVLSAILSPTSIPKWLDGPNVHLGDRTPMYLLKTGDVAACSGPWTPCAPGLTHEQLPPGCVPSGPGQPSVSNSWHLT